MAVASIYLWSCLFLWGHPIWACHGFPWEVFGGPLGACLGSLWGSFWGPVEVPGVSCVFGRSCRFLDRSGGGRWENLGEAFGSSWRRGLVFFRNRVGIDVCAFLILSVGGYFLIRVQTKRNNAAPDKSGMRSSQIQGRLAVKIPNRIEHSIKDSMHN